MVFVRIILLNIFLLLFCELVLQISLEDDFLDTMIKIQPLEYEISEASLEENKNIIENDIDNAIVRKRDTNEIKVALNKIDPSLLINSIQVEKRHNDKKALQEERTKAARPSEDKELHITGDQSLLKSSNLENEDLDYESNPIFMPPIEEDLHQREERQEHKKPHNVKNIKTPIGPKIWDHWGKWSACSVTCGVGKLTRWRHCVQGGCASGEKEAQIKTCTSPAC